MSRYIVLKSTSSTFDLMGQFFYCSSNNWWETIQDLKSCRSLRKNRKIKQKHQQTFNVNIIEKKKTPKNKRPNHGKNERKINNAHNHIPVTFLMCILCILQNNFSCKLEAIASQMAETEGRVNILCSKFQEKTAPPKLIHWFEVDTVPLLLAIFNTLAWLSSELQGS